MSNNFVPRTVAPDVTNKYYRHTGYLHSGVDGLNECVLINRTTGEVMPNCVGYTWGRAFEILGSRPSLTTGDAQNWYNFDDGYQRGSEPRVGAIACFTRPARRDGHVCVVEIDNGDGSWQCSSSDYGGVYFRMETLSKVLNRWILTNHTNFTFQGFIYLPEPVNTLPIWLMKKIKERSE